MDDNEFRAIASRIGRRKWGVRVATFSDAPYDRYARHRSLWTRFLDRFVW